MNRILLRPWIHFWLGGREYTIEECLTKGELIVREELTSTRYSLKETALIQLIFRGDLTFEPNRKTQKKLDYERADFTQLPEKVRDEAKRKYNYVKLALESNVIVKTKKCLEPIIERIAKEINDPSPPSWVTFYRWIKTYSEAGCDIRSLVPKHKAKGNSVRRLQAEVIQIIDKAISQIYLTRSRPTVADVCDEVLHQIQHENKMAAAIGKETLKVPHHSTIYAIISKREPFELASSRYGKRIAAQKYQPVKLGPRPKRPLERVEIDHTKLPLFIVDTENRMPIGTPWFTSAIDKYSGTVLGYYASFEPPSYLSVMQCLLHAIKPKNYLHSLYPNIEKIWNAYGLPEVIVVDNGKEFYSSHFEDACLSLGIVIQYCPPKMPWYKSAIERYFGSLNTQLLSNKPGKKFSELMKQYDYDPQKNAVISFQAFQEILHLFIVDIYNQSSHPEYNFSRAEVWKKALVEFPPALPPSSHKLNVLLGRIVERKISRRGIEFEGLIYNSCELARLRDRVKTSSKTKVKYDPTDLSRVYVFDKDNYQFLEVPALNQEYTQNLTLWQHLVIKQLARQNSKTVDIVALALAKEKIEKIVAREWNTSKKNKTRQSMARWLGIRDDNAHLVENKISLETEISNNFNVEYEQFFPASYNTQTANISRKESAFNPSKNSSIDNLSSKINSLEISSKKAKQDNARQPENLSSMKDSLEITNSDNWKPDLAGWDISYGLPK